MNHDFFAKGRALSAVCALALGVGISADAARAQDVTFAGKRVNVIIGTTPGGGTDISTRLLGKYLSKHLPGQPQMVYRNMPGGNGVVACNFFASEAPRDGTLWMGGGNGYIDADTLRKTDLVKYDPRDFNFIGGIVRGGSVMMVHKDKIANLHDKSKPPVVVGMTDGFDVWSGMALWAAAHGGFNTRFVIGYPGTSAMTLALRRGEIDSFGTSNITILRPLEKQGYVPVLQTGQLEDGKVVGQPSWPNVPIVSELLEGKIDGEAERVFDYWFKSTQIDKWYSLPPGVDSNIVAVYNTSYRNAVNDPEFRKAGEHQFGEGFGTQSGADVLEITKARSYPSVKTLDFIRDMKLAHGLPSAPLSEEAKKALAAKLITMKKVSSAITEIEREGRVLHFKAGDEMHKVNVSGSRTEVKIGGKDGKRGNITTGMTCEVTYPANGGEAQAVHCK